MRLPLVTRHNTNRIKISTRILASTMHCYVTMKCLLKMQPGYCSPQYCQYCIYLWHRCDVISLSRKILAVLSLPVLESVHYVKQEKKPFEEGRAEETCKVALITIQPANLGFKLIS